MLKALLFKYKRSSLIAVLMMLCTTGINARSVSAALSGELSQAPKQPIVQKLGVVGPTIDSDEYVQSEAHLQIPEAKEKVANFIMRVPGDRSQIAHPLTANQMITPYLNLVAQVINKEVEFKNSHYVFYQATNNEWRVPQDLYKKLYINYKKSASPLNDFAFVRFSDCKSIKAKDYLQESIEKFGGVNDNVQEVRDVLLSVNIALFGNAGFPGECTWNYFLEAKSHRWPMPQNYYQVLNAFDVTYDIEALAKEAQVLSEMLVNASEEQTLLQFFIPHNIADDVAYLAWLLGFPAHRKSVELMEELLEGKPRVGAYTGPAVKSVMKKFRKQQNNPVYKELVQAAEEGAFGVSGFLKALCTNPLSLKYVNETQARLLVTKDVLQNPASGTKIFSYFTTPENVQKSYMQKLDALAAKIIAQENSKSPQQKAADKEKNEVTFARLKKEEEEKKAAEKAAAKPTKGK